MRGLAPDSTQEEIRDRFGAEIMRLAAPLYPITDGRYAIQRVVLIRNKYTKSCLGFGFIQLATPQLATALLSHLLSRTAQPVGFVINARPVACSFANAHAFVDVGPGGLSEPWCFPMRNLDRVLGGIAGPAANGVTDGISWVKYWDDTCGASDLAVSLESDALPREPALQAFLDGLAASDASAAKDIPSALASGTGTPLAPGALGAIKMAPLKIGGKKKEQDAMVSLPVAGVEKPLSSGRCHAAASYSADPSAAANVFGQEDDEPAALPSKSTFLALYDRPADVPCSLSWKK